MTPGQKDHISSPISRWFCGQDSPWQRWPQTSHLQHVCDLSICNVCHEVYNVSYWIVCMHLGYDLYGFVNTKYIPFLRHSCTHCSVIIVFIWAEGCSVACHHQPCRLYPLACHHQPCRLYLLKLDIVVFHSAMTTTYSIFDAEQFNMDYFCNASNNLSKKDHLISDTDAIKNHQSLSRQFANYHLLQIEWYILHTHKSI